MDNTNNIYNVKELSDNERKSLRKELENKIITNIIPDHLLQYADKRGFIGSITAIPDSTYSVKLDNWSDGITHVKMVLSGIPSAYRLRYWEVASTGMMSGGTEDFTASQIVKNIDIIESAIGDIKSKIEVLYNAEQNKERDEIAGLEKLQDLISNRYNINDGNQDNKNNNNDPTYYDIFKS